MYTATGRSTLTLKCISAGESVGSKQCSSQACPSSIPSAQRGAYGYIGGDVTDTGLPSQGDALRLVTWGFLSGFQVFLKGFHFLPYVWHLKQKRDKDIKIASPSTLPNLVALGVRFS